MISDQQICIMNIYRLIAMLATINASAGDNILGIVPGLVEQVPQQVTGQVTGMVPEIYAKAIAVLSSNQGVVGTVTFIQELDGSTTVCGSIAGLTPGPHGFHIHTNGDISENCKNTGPHFNPFDRNHGGPYDLDRHAGDLGNIIANDEGIAEFTITVHALPDDLGQGGTPLSKTTGNSGEKIACGVIGIQGQ